MKKWIFALVCLLLPGALCGAARADAFLKSGLQGVADIRIEEKSNVIWQYHGNSSENTWEDVPRGKFYVQAGRTSCTEYFKAPDVPASFGRTDFLAWKVIYPDGCFDIALPGDKTVAMGPAGGGSTSSTRIDMTLLALWDGLEQNSITLQTPESISVTENAAQTEFGMTVSGLSLGSADNVTLIFTEGVLECGSYRIPYTLGVNGSLGLGGYFKVLRAPGFSANMSICIAEEAWQAARAGVYRGSLTWQAEFNGVRDKSRCLAGRTIRVVSGSIPITLTVGHTVSAEENGNGTVEMSSSMARTNETVTLEAVPKAGYRFREWQVISGGVTIRNNRFTMGSSDVRIRAVFEQIGTVTFRDWDGTLLQSGAVAFGETPAYSGGTPARTDADPHTGYVFTGWTPDVAPVSGNVTYTAQYRKETYYLVEFITDSGSGTMESAKVPVSSGEYRLPVCTFIPPEGTVFQCWETKDTEGVWNVGYSAGYILRNVRSDLTVRPQWQESRILTDVWPQDSGYAVYDAAAGTFTAIPKPGYGFKGWVYADLSGISMLGYDSTDPVYTPENVLEGTYTAEFTALDFSVTAAAVGSGTVSAVPASCKAGTEVTVTAVPAEGWRLKSLTPATADVSQEIVYAVVIDSGNRFAMPPFDVLVIAEFEEDVYPVTVSADPAAGGGTGGEGSYAPGAVVALSAAANAGYRFTGWRILSGGAVMEDGRFTMPAGPVEAQAVFEPVYTITGDGAALAGRDGGYSEALTGVAAGERIFLRLDEAAAPEEGYFFTGEFSVNGTGLGTAAAFDMPAGDVAVGAVRVPREALTLPLSPGASLGVSAGALAQLRGGEKTAALFSRGADGKETVDLDGSGIPDIAVSGNRMTLLAGYDAFGSYEYTFSGRTDRFSPITFALPIPAFGDPDLRIPAGTGSIGASAFEGTAATAAEIPDNCASIGSYAFRNCPNLVRIRIPSSVKSIGADIFSGCGTVFVFGAADSAAREYCLTHTGCIFVAE